jgi:hypothetical protein
MLSRPVPATKARAWPASSTYPTIRPTKRIAESPGITITTLLNTEYTSENSIEVDAKGVAMADSEPNFKITQQTDLELVEGDFTPTEKQWLEKTGILKIDSYHTNTREATSVSLDVPKLAQLAFEYQILKDIASSVETDIMEAFRRTSDNVLTTAQLADATDRPKSSISRALSRLVEKNKLHRVQAGVYQQVE